jgi:hypothetical protein
LLFTRIYNNYSIFLIDGPYKVITNFTKLSPLQTQTMLLFMGLRQYLSDWVYMQGKGKAIPLQAWRGPEGSRSLRRPDFKKIST